MEPDAALLELAVEFFDTLCKSFTSNAAEPQCRVAKVDTRHCLIQIWFEPKPSGPDSQSFVQVNLRHLIATLTAADAHANVGFTSNHAGQAIIYIHTNRYSSTFGPCFVTVAIEHDWVGQPTGQSDRRVVDLGG